MDSTIPANSREAREDFCVLIRPFFGADWKPKTAWTEDRMTVEYAYLHHLSLLNEHSQIEYAIGHRARSVIGYSKADNDKAKGLV